MYFFDLFQREVSIPKSTLDPIYPAGSEASRNATLSITNLTEPAAWIDVYYPVLDTPLDRSLEILGDDKSVVWRADLEETADQLDSDAHAYADAVGAWHGLSKHGEVEGRLLYAKYGTKSDYDELVEKGGATSLRLPFPILTRLNLGVDFNGTIVLVRYGRNYRGLKVSTVRSTLQIHYSTPIGVQVKRAQELGAAGVLMYSDPQDDGTVTEKNGYAA
jgi:N-acetylated-alpha-linked acidic dipeptidase